MVHSTSKPTLAFFGATGGCTAAALALALKNGYSCSARTTFQFLDMRYNEVNTLAVARTPSKLTDLLSTKDVPEQAISSHLRITQGDVKDISAVKQALVNNEQVVDIIISGIGMPMGLTIPDTTICASATRSIIAALSDLNPTKKPFIVIISSTGISSGPRDVPLAFAPLYHLGLRVPHADKRIMEETVVDSGSSHPNGGEKPQVFDGYTIVRPSFLTNGKACGPELVRVGSEQKPAVGYTISRNDIGKWIFDEVVAGDRKKWSGEKVTLTY
ncbi:hypothetical protein MMC24_003088 [Lignoscripta atroalba]|nr:hypothetical protein [Lignoscripta atroalba]